MGGRGGNVKMECCRMLQDGGLANVLVVQYFFFIKENWICTMIRHYAEANINISLARNLPFDSDVRQ